MASRGIGVRFRAQIRNYTFSKGSTSSLRLTKPTILWIPAPDPRNLKITTQIHLVTRSRMYRTIPPFLLYVFMLCCLIQHIHNFTLNMNSIPRKVNNSYKKKRILLWWYKAHTSQKCFQYSRHLCKCIRNAGNRKPASQLWRNSNTALFETRHQLCPLITGKKISLGIK
jgi:hypothetical protein